MQPQRALSASRPSGLDIDFFRVVEVNVPGRESLDLEPCHRPCDWDLCYALVDADHPDLLLESRTLESWAYYMFLKKSTISGLEATGAFPGLFSGPCRVHGQSYYRFIKKSTTFGPEASGASPGLFSGPCRFDRQSYYRFI